MLKLPLGINFCKFVLPHPSSHDPCSVYLRLEIIAVVVVGFDGVKQRFKICKQGPTLHDSALLEYLPSNLQSNITSFFVGFDGVKQQSKTCKQGLTLHDSVLLEYLPSNLQSNITL